MYIQVISVNKPQNKDFIGKIYKVIRTKKDKNQKWCYVVNGTRKIFQKTHCIVLNNVLQFKRKRS
jgi:hypothetical protein